MGSLQDDVQEDLSKPGRRRFTVGEGTPSVITITTSAVSFFGFRKNVFKNNLRTIRSHNFQADLGRYTYRLGVNEYADYSQEEMREYFTGYNFNSSKPVQGVTFLPPKNLELPKEVDWREEGYVTPVKNQVGWTFLRLPSACKIWN